MFMLGNVFSVSNLLLTDWVVTMNYWMVMSYCCCLRQAQLFESLQFLWITQASSLYLDEFYFFLKGMIQCICTEPASPVGRTTWPAFIIKPILTNLPGSIWNLKRLPLPLKDHLKHITSAYPFCWVKLLWKAYFTNCFNCAYKMADWAQKVSFPHLFSVGSVCIV